MFTLRFTPVAKKLPYPGPRIELLDMLAQVSHCYIIDEQAEVDNQANYRQALEESVLCHDNNRETARHCVAQD